MQTNPMLGIQNAQVPKVAQTKVSKQIAADFHILWQCYVPKIIHIEIVPNKH